jgi:hypothetical protein
LPAVDEPPSIDALAQRVGYAWKQWHGRGDHRSALWLRCYPG